jgi:flagellar motility protein MotE (MotC chaperone)
VRVQEEEATNLKKLAKVYASMEVEGAASILKELNDEQIVKIMIFMKESETASIFETLAKRGKDEARRVALISERLRAAVHRKASDKPKS